MKPVQFVPIAVAFARVTLPGLAKQHLNHRLANTTSLPCASAVSKEAGTSRARMDPEMKVVVEMHAGILAVAPMQERDALIGGYAGEVHVPARNILRLLMERPMAVGIAGPAMPVGSPDMDGPAYEGSNDTYAVLMVQRDGYASVYQSYR